MREVTAALPGNHTGNVMDVLRWPGVVREENTGSDEVVAAARALFDEIVSRISWPRSGREGVRLREVIEQRCATPRCSRGSGARASAGGSGQGA